MLTPPAAALFIFVVKKRHVGAIDARSISVHGAGNRVGMSFNLDFTPGKE